MIIAVAGRRVDAAGAETPRFPLENVALVGRRIDERFEREGATALVSSAACGADLVALTVAGRRGMRRRVVLPFGREKFRETSVTDRPGDWGPVYDRVLDELDVTGDVVTLEGLGDGDAAYLAANDHLLREAEALGATSNRHVPQGPRSAHGTILVDFHHRRRRDGFEHQRPRDRTTGGGSRGSCWRKQDAGRQGGAPGA